MSKPEDEISRMSDEELISEYREQQNFLRGVHQDGIHPNAYRWREALRREMDRRGIAWN